MCAARGSVFWSFNQADNLCIGSDAYAQVITDSKVDRCQVQPLEPCHEACQLILYILPHSVFELGV